MNQNFTEKQQVAAVKAFASRWQGRGYEKGETQTFWIEMLRDVFGVEQPTEHIVFEKQVRAASTQFIDAYIPSTRVLIEQKSVEKALISRDSATGNTPYGQALNYANKMVFSEKPHWIIVCNFAEFHIYDLDVSENIRKPYIFKLADLPRELKHLRMLTDGRSERQVREEEVSIKAGEIVAQIYSALRRQYADDSPRALRWLNILCVRMVFCLYAEDAGIFRRDQFHNYLADTPADDLREALLKLFSTFNTPVEKRSPYMKPSLVAFPYANGGLFAEEIEIPLFTEELKQTLLQNASLGFDWSDISPVIFGAIFEDTLSGEVRREGGMHYTSVANIHKVIDPLFLDGLEQELDTGNMPRDGGGFILTQDERDALIVAEPLAAQWIHPFLGADEFLNNKPRYCLWLQGANPAELRRCPTVMARIERVRQMRLASSAASTRRMAETPTLFAQITQPIGHEFIIVPGVSSERRRYVPMGFMGKDIIASNLVFVVPDATLYHFGVLESSVHMAWMRAVCGRLKSDYRYSKDIVYNNFPWPEIEKIDSIEKTAQAILDARALFPEASLADLYDELTMLPELRRAHQANDRAVLTAYGFNNKMTEAEIVADLFKKYQKK